MFYKGQMIGDCPDKTEVLTKQSIREVSFEVPKQRFMVSLINRGIRNP